MRKERISWKKYRSLNKYFRDWIISHLVKIRKPDLEIYKMILNKFSNKNNPKNCIYIDDKEKLLLSTKKLWFLRYVLKMQSRTKIIWRFIYSVL